MSEIRRDDDGTLDEVVAENAHVHLENLGPHGWFLVINDKEGRTALNIFGKRLSWPWKPATIGVNVIDKNLP